MNKDLFLKGIGGIFIITFVSIGFYIFNQKGKTNQLYPSQDNLRTQVVPQQSKSSEKVANSTTSGITPPKISSNNTNEIELKKSKNPQFITFIKDGDVYVYSLETKQVKKLTNYRYNSVPVLSPTNDKIAYLSVPLKFVEEEKAQKGYKFEGPATYQDYWNVWVIDVDGKNPRKITNSLEKRGSLSWSPDGNKIIFNEGKGIAEYDIKNDSKNIIIENGYGAVYSPLNSHLAYLSLDHQSINIIFANGEKKTIKHSEYIIDLQWSNDEAKIFFTSENLAIFSKKGPAACCRYSIWTFSLENNKAVKLIGGDKIDINSPLPSLGGDFILAQEGNLWYDAGSVSVHLAILKIDNNKITDTLHLKDILGETFFEEEKECMIPTIFDNHGQNTLRDTETLWLNDSEFVAKLDTLYVGVMAGCIKSDKPKAPGVYKIDVRNKTAKRLVDLADN